MSVPGTVRRDYSSLAAARARRCIFTNDRQRHLNAAAAMRVVTSEIVRVNAAPPKLPVQRASKC
jgi:hypothetical protein